MRAVRAGITLVVGLLALALPLFLVPMTTHTTWSTVLARFAELTWAQFALLGSVWLAGLFVHTYVTTGALPGLSHRRALVLNFSGSTISHLAPFGGVLGMGLNYSMLRSWGFDGHDFTVLVLLSNAWNALVRLALPTLALVLLLAATDFSTSGLLVVAGVGLVACAAIAGVIGLAARPSHAETAGRVHRSATAALARIVGQPAHDVTRVLRTNVAGAVRRSWRRMSAGMLVYILLQALLLLLCLACVGCAVTPLAVFAAYATGAALSLVPLTPGGVGFAEAGTAALLVAFGAPPAGAAAGVLLFSTFTRWMEIPFGAAGMAWWWFRRSAPTYAPIADPA